MLALPAKFAAERLAEQFGRQVIEQFLGGLAQHADMLLANPGFFPQLAQGGGADILAVVDPALRHLPENTVSLVHSKAIDPAADKLHFVVREAWPGRGFGATLIEGEVTRENPLVIESRMDAGIIFADGIEGDPLRFDAGVSVRIAPSERRVRLVQ